MQLVVFINHSLRGKVKMREKGDLRMSHDNQERVELWTLYDAVCLIPSFKKKECRLHKHLNKCVFVILTR